MSFRALRDGHHESRDDIHILTRSLLSDPSSVPAIIVLAGGSANIYLATSDEG